MINALRLLLQFLKISYKAILIIKIVKKNEKIIERNRKYCINFNFFDILKTVLIFVLSKTTYLKINRE